MEYASFIHQLSSPIRKEMPVDFNFLALSGSMCLTGFPRLSLNAALEKSQGRKTWCRWSEMLSECVFTKLVAAKLAGVKRRLRKHKDLKWHTHSLIQNISCTDQVHSCPTLSPIHQIPFSVMTFYTLYRLKTGGFLETVINLTDIASTADRGPLESTCYQLPNWYLPHTFTRNRNDQLYGLQFTSSNR